MILPEIIDNVKRERERDLRVIIISIHIVCKNNKQIHRFATVSNPSLQVQGGAPCDAIHA